MSITEKRILNAASAIIGICCSFLLIVYLDAPQDFQLRRHIGLFAIMAAMSLFIRRAPLETAKEQWIKVSATMKNT